MTPAPPRFVFIILIAALNWQCAGNTQERAAPLTHSFFLAGSTTCIRNFTPGGPAEGTMSWSHPLGTRGTGGRPLKGPAMK